MRSTRQNNHLSPISQFLNNIQLINVEDNVVANNLSRVCDHNIASFNKLHISNFEQLPKTNELINFYS